MTNEMKLKNKLREAYEHIKPYIDDESELISMCERCEQYCGKEHDYDECINKPCFKFFLAYAYMRWSESYE